MSGKREKCKNCGKLMRRLYMQKNKASGRGMVASGWLCESCNFSDIITKFKDKKPDVKLHPALTCKCQMCGVIHNKGILEKNEDNNISKIIKQISNYNNRNEGLILVNNMENVSEYLGLVLGLFIWENNPIAKSVYLNNATHLQNEIINSVWKESWRLKGWQPILRKKLKKRIQECGINYEHIIGMGIILNQKVTESTIEAIETIQSPHIYIDTAIENGNVQLAEYYAKKATDEGDQEMAANYMHWAIKGGNRELLNQYVSIKGKEAATLIIELIKNNKYRLSEYSHTSYAYTGDLVYEYYNALSKTRSKEAAIFLIKELFNDNLSLQRRMEEIADKDSKEPILRALATLPKSFQSSEIVAALVAEIEDHAEIEFLLDIYDDLDFKELISPNPFLVENEDDKLENIRKFVLKNTGPYSDCYKRYLLKKDPEGIRKFIFNHDSGLRLMGISMCKSEKLDYEIKEFIFMMSFLDSEESVRDKAAEIVKERDICKSLEIEKLDDIIFPLMPETWQRTESGYERVQTRDFKNRDEFLKRLIDYENEKFLPIILEYVKPESDINSKLDSFLKSLDKDNTFDILLEIALKKAPTYCSRNAIRKAFVIDKIKTNKEIINAIQMKTGTERTKRKNSVNRRLMFIDIFAENARINDLPQIEELMRKDRSPRVKRKFAELIMKLTHAS